MNEASQNLAKLLFDDKDGKKYMEYICPMKHCYFVFSPGMIVSHTKSWWRTHHQFVIFNILIFDKHMKANIPSKIWTSPPYQTDYEPSKSMPDMFCQLVMYAFK